jgi:hypothetical protein
VKSEPKHESGILVTLIDAKVYAPPLALLENDESGVRE